jgi:putative membrane protein
MQAHTDTPIPGYRTPAGIIAAIIAISVVASALILWLVYRHKPVDASAVSFQFLPGLNAILNAASATALVIGFRFIRRGRMMPHRTSMFAAFIFSSAFLVSYLATYYLHGETHLPIAHSGALWYTYLTVLITHIPLAIVALPMILVTFFFSLSGRFPAHRAIARWTFPIWLYVSVSGVFIYFLQAVIH